MPAQILISFGGEAVLPEKVRQWQTCVDERWRRQQLGEPPLLINAYGPTEATVEAMLCKLSESVLKDTCSQVPIGRPIGNVQAYILDRYLQSKKLPLATLFQAATVEAMASIIRQEEWLAP